MALPGLLNLSVDELGFWAQHNADQHTLVVREVLAQRGFQLQTFLLFPLDEELLPRFLEAHQQAHNQINGVLGIEGSNLRVLDFGNPRQVASWTAQHFREHWQWAEELRI